MKEIENKYRLLYGHGNWIYGHEDFKTDNERQAYSSGFNDGAHQYGGEESFTLDVEELEFPLDDDYYTFRYENAKKYLHDLNEAS